MKHESIHQKYVAALDALIEQVKGDRSILAAILCGSLSHDTVWARSDIDLVLVTIDDKKVETSDLTLNADGISVHAFLFPRVQFQKDRGRVGPQLVRPLAAREGPPPLYTRPVDFGPLREADRDWRTGHADSAHSRGDACLGVDRQGAQMVRHPTATSTTRRSGFCMRRRRWRSWRSSART